MPSASRGRRPMERFGGVTLLLAIASAVLASAGTAHAATAYRYWAFYIGHGSSWAYSQRGPASEYPVDGEVQGWRFAVQTDVAGGLMPRAAPTFAALCASKPPKPGQLRVAVVLDFGAAGDAPAHEAPPAGVVPGCVYVPDGASGADVLQAAATMRVGTGADAGLVCGIDNYPKTECATVVTESTKAAEPTPAGTPTKAAHPTSSAGPKASATALISREPPVSVAPAAPASAPPSAPPSSARVIPLAAPAAAAPSTLDELRTSTHHRQHFPASALVGTAVVVLLGGGALWRARAGRS